jgi:phosphatidylethanolamine/phosphatidyl-N-methylethanolamine N-methyltransferase
MVGSGPQVSLEKSDNGRVTMSESAAGELSPSDLRIYASCAQGPNVRGCDVAPFLRAWLANPLRVGSIRPSGAALADLMTSEISPETGPVIELGPGTGVFTRALLARGVRERDLTLVECGSDFAEILDRRFPQARVLRSDAARLHQAALFSGAPVGAVVSGLPLLSMPPTKIMAVFAGAFRYLRPGGALYQFTYIPRCPVPREILDRLGLRAVRMGSAIANIPPASAYRFTRRAAPLLNGCVPRNRGILPSDLPRI